MKIPIVYREAERNVFHSALEYHGNMYVFGGITPNIHILILPKPHNESLEVKTTLEEYMLNTAKDKYEYLEKEEVAIVKDDISEVKSFDEISLDKSVSNDKSKLDDSMINENNQLIKDKEKEKDKKSGKYSYSSSLSPVTPEKKSGKTSFKKDMFEDYEIKEK